MTAATTFLSVQKVTIQIALGFFFLGALLGVLMRYFYLQEISFLKYNNLLHAHSHIAMLGWGFTALASTLVFIFFPTAVLSRAFRYGLIGNIVSGLGMFLAFLLQGYAPISIGFSVLHVFIAYYFSWHFLKHLNGLESSNAVIFAKWAIYLMVFSTFGLWAVAPVSIILGKLHPLYFASIQFFLHFQFNGWFTFGILALLFNHSEKNGCNIRLPKGSILVLLISLILTYTLSITWSTPENFLFFLNSIGVLLQLVAFILIAKGVYQSSSFSFRIGTISYWLLLLGLMSLGLKVIIQAAVAIPIIAMVSYTIRNFVIGFIHLTMLGAFSLSLMAILHQQKLIPHSAMANYGYRLLIIGFILTEGLLFLQGVLLWAEKGFLEFYYTAIFSATLILPIALILVIISSFQSKLKLTI